MLQMRKSKFGKVKWLSKVIHLVGSDPRVYNSFLQIEDIGDKWVKKKREQRIDVHFSLFLERKFRVRVLLMVNQ